MSVKTNNAEYRFAVKKSSRSISLVLFVCIVAFFSQRAGAEERFLPLEGPENFRDLGGYATTNGESLAWGMVYRSDVLSTLTENDLDYLNHLGLKSVLDIRGEGEVAHAPDILDPAWSYEFYPAVPDEFSLDLAPYASICDQTPHIFTKYYCAMIDQLPDRVGAILTKIFDAEKPVVFHCSGGQDRTGIIAAIILLMLGVPEDTVAVDYTLSPNFDPSLSSRMEQTICHIKDSYGSVENYVYNVCYVPVEKFVKFKEDFVPGATLIELSNLQAIPGKHEVVIVWSTSSEIDHSGFNLYRSESEKGEYIKINDALIPAQGNSTEGAEYEFIDGDLQNRQTYYYQLEDVDTAGVSTMHGPVSATPRLLLGN